MNLIEKVNKEVMSNTKDVISGGVIGRVVRYHPPKGNAPELDGSDKKAGRCFCSRHKGRRMEMFERHTVDVEVTTEMKTTVWEAVPCFMYAQGIIDHGFRENDKVYIQFINNDLSHPVAIAYYRPPTKLDNFWNSLKFSMANFVDEYIISAIQPESLAESATGVSNDVEVPVEETPPAIDTEASTATKNVITTTTTPPMQITATKERT